MSVVIRPYIHLTRVTWNNGSWRWYHRSYIRQVKPFDQTPLDNHTWYLRPVNSSFFHGVWNATASRNTHLFEELFSVILANSQIIFWIAPNTLQNWIRTLLSWWFYGSGDPYGQHSHSKSKQRVPDEDQVDFRSKHTMFQIEARTMLRDANTTYSLTEYTALLSPYLQIVMQKSQRTLNQWIFANREAVKLSSILLRYVCNSNF